MKKAKRKLFSLLLAVAMVFTFIPTQGVIMAQSAAAPISSTGGKLVLNGSGFSVDGDAAAQTTLTAQKAPSGSDLDNPQYTWFYDDGYLYLNGFIFTTTAMTVLSVEREAVIWVAGDNTIAGSGDSTVNAAYGIICDWDLTIMGNDSNDSLTVVSSAGASAYGISMSDTSGALYIEDVTLNILDSGDDVLGTAFGIDALGTIKVTNSVLTVNAKDSTSGDSYGIRLKTAGKTFTVEDSIVTVTAGEVSSTLSSFGIHLANGDNVQMVIDGDSVVTATGKAGNKSQGLYLRTPSATATEPSIVMNGGTLIAVGEKSAASYLYWDMPSVTIEGGQTENDTLSPFVWTLGATPGPGSDQYKIGTSSAALYKYVKFTYAPPVPAATVADVTVTGNVDEAVAATDVVISLTGGVTFIGTNPNPSGSDYILAADPLWNTLITNQPGGVTVKASGNINTSDDATQVTLQISGTPTEVITDALEITIPGSILSSGTDLTVTANSNAKWDIGAARDLTSPAYVSSTIDGDTLVITFNEDLEDATLRASDFALKVNGTAVTLNTNTVVTISGRTITLKLPSAAATFGDTVTIAYSWTSGGNIKDAADNKTTSFSVQNVTNNSPRGMLDFTSGGLHEDTDTYDGATGTAEWDATTKILILDNFSWPTNAATAAKIPGETKIILIGDNSISTTSTATDDAYGLYSAGAFSVSSAVDGTLTITHAGNESYGVHSGATITVESGTLDATGGKYGVYAHKAAGNGLPALGTITVKDTGKLNGTATSGTGIYTWTKLTVSDDAAVKGTGSLLGVNVASQTNDNNNPASQVSIKVSDNATLEGTDGNGEKSYGIMMSYRLDVSENAKVTATAGTATSNYVPSSVGIAAHGNYGEINTSGGLIEAYGEHYGVYVSSITPNSLKTSGVVGGANREARLPLSFGSTGKNFYITGESSTAYQKYVRIDLPASATVGNQTVSGTINEALTSTTITITLENDTIIADGVESTSSVFAGMIQNLPAGLSASASGNVAGGADSFNLVITGTPTAAASGAISIKIPASILTRGKEVTVDTNANVSRRHV